MRKLFLVKTFTSLFLLCNLSNAAAETTTFPEMKPTGVSVEWYQHELDLKVTDFQTALPGITPEVVNSVKNQLAATSNLELINVRLDHQIHPYINVYGAVGKVNDKTDVNFSVLGPGLSDMTIDSSGTAYTIGTHLSRTYGRWKPAIHYFHSRLRLDENSEDVKINALIPSIGLQTDYGVFSGSLIYQAIEATHSGTIAAPVLGDVPVTVITENNDKIQIAAGWHKQLASDWFIKADVGLNGQKQLQLQLNKRF